MATAAWNDFLTAARGGEPDRVAVALGSDCVFIPPYNSLNTLDYFMYPDHWLRANLAVIERFPDLVVFPGFWVEFGMANEPSAFGTPVLWKANEAPGIRHLSIPVDQWGTLPQPDPRADGLMAMVVRRYRNLEGGGELPDPHRVRIVAARGPFTTAAHLVGMTALLTAAADPDERVHVQRLLAITAQVTLDFLQAQLSCLREPEGVLLLDDTVGMLSPRLFKTLAVPALNQVFDAFPDLIRMYHNDTPCPHLLTRMGELHFDMWHFSHTMDIADVRAALPDRALMGNLAPIDLMTHGTPAQVEAATHDIIERVGRKGLIISLGGGTNAETRLENIDAMVRAARGAPG